MPTFSFSPMTERDARDILAWRYPSPYTFYNLFPPDADPSEAQRDQIITQSLSELCDPRSPHFAARMAGAALPAANGLAASEMVDDPLGPIGFYALGSSAEVGVEIETPWLLRPDGSATIGLGLRPDLTGRGLGQRYVEAILATVSQQYQPAVFRLYVVDWNERARTIYERVGFQRVGVKRVTGQNGPLTFIEMTRAPGPLAALAAGSVG